MAIMTSSMTSFPVGLLA